MYVFWEKDVHVFQKALACFFIANMAENIFLISAIFLSIQCLVHPSSAFIGCMPCFLPRPIL